MFISFISALLILLKTVKAITDGIGAGFIEHDLTFSFSEEEFYLQKMRSPL